MGPKHRSKAKTFSIMFVYEVEFQLANMNLKKSKTLRTKKMRSRFAILEIAVEMMNYVCGAWV